MAEKPQPGYINPRKKKAVTGKPGATAAALSEGVLSGNIGLLSKAITYIESDQPAHRAIASEILRTCLPHSGNALRIGITGIPGAGKSTFIEAAGSFFLRDGARMAVLTIDPSSQRTGGSILGDKTRMENLSRHPDVFIRPSPSGGTLGGVTRATRETICLCEAAGYSVILVETVGVGQSEVAVHSMVDLFLLIAIAGAGDELQGIKRGIMEMADMIVVNKAEAENSKSSRLTARQLENAIHLFPQNPYGFTPEVKLCSALSGMGMEAVHDELLELAGKLRASGQFDRRRKDQTTYWMKESIASGLMKEFYAHPEIAVMLARMEQDVHAGKVSPFEAADLLLQKFYRK